MDPLKEKRTKKDALTVLLTQDVYIKESHFLDFSGPILTPLRNVEAPGNKLNRQFSLAIARLQ